MDKRKLVAIQRHPARFQCDFDFACSNTGAFSSLVVKGDFIGHDFRYVAFFRLDFEAARGHTSGFAERVAVLIFVPRRKRKLAHLERSGFGVFAVFFDANAVGVHLCSFNTVRNTDTIRRKRGFVVAVSNDAAGLVELLFELFVDIRLTYAAAFAVTAAGARFCKPALKVCVRVCVLNVRLALAGVQDHLHVGVLCKEIAQPRKVFAVRVYEVERLRRFLVVHFEPARGGTVAWRFERHRHTVVERALRNNFNSCHIPLLNLQAMPSARRYCRCARRFS